MKKLVYLVTAIISIVGLLCSISVFAESEEKASKTEGALYAHISVLEQPDKKHVYFGSYPQTEIVQTANQCVTYGTAWATDSDYIINETLYSTLQNATWNSNNDTTVEGTKYRRIKTTTYHYFKYEPIKWRILKLTENDAFLLSEGALDDQLYNTTYEFTPITWENCTVRSWLNSTFYNMAFTNGEQSAIKITDVVNELDAFYGIPGGNNTKDKIFLLSVAEVYGNNATQYGFAWSYSDNDKARQMKSSTYAKAMGVESETYSSFLGNCYWWLRTPESSEYCGISDVSSSGIVLAVGNCCNHTLYGIVPALHINLKSNDPIKACETITDITLSSDCLFYTGEEVKPSVNIDGLTEGTDYTLNYSNNVEPGTATVTVTGTGEWSGTVKKTFEIKSSITISGKVTGYSGSNLSVLLRDSSGDERTSTSANYSFGNLSNRLYTLSAFADGDYVPHEYNVTVQGQNVIQDITLNLLGDANCDGVRTAEDVTKIARHLARISIEEDEYMLKVFNTDKQGDKPSAADVTHLARYLAMIINEL